MERTPVTKCPGWVTQYNPLNIEPGSLLQAENVVFPRENVTENRKGHREAGTLSNTPTNSLVYSKRHIVHNGTAVSYETASGDVYANYSGSYTSPTSFRMKGGEANLNLYTTTNAGVKVFQDIAGTAARAAGMPRALDLGPTGNATGTMVNADVAGFLSNNNQCAYRAVLYRTDQNNNLLIGYPSQRLWVTNTSGGLASTTIRNYLPSTIVAGDVLRIFRTTQVSGVSSDTAGDEEGLVYSATLTSTDISNGYVDFTDRIIDELIGETIYTAPGQGGIAQGNVPPPLSKAIAFYKNAFMFYGNTETEQQLYLTLVGTSGLSSNTITLAGSTYNFGASEIQSGGGSPQAAVSTGGTAAQNIDATARSLVRVINRYASNTSVYAYYISGPDDLPGQILIRARSVGSAAFTVHCNAAGISSMFDPPPPTSAPSSGRSVSSNESVKNRLYYSKYQQPEHTIGAGYYPVGSANYEILDLVPLRDSLIIIKEEGVFRLVGDSENSFVITTLDDTVYCRARNSITKLENQVFMLSNKGFVAISDTGVEIVSRNIANFVKRLLSFTNLDTYTAAYGIESDSEYRISLPAENTDTVATQTLVYNVLTRAWSKSDVVFVSGVVEQSRDKVFFTKPSSVKVFQERRSYTDDDYYDIEVSVVVTTVDVSAGTIGFTVSGYTPKVGDLISQNGSTLYIDAVSQDPSTLVWSATMEGTIPGSWAAGAGTLYPSVVADCIYNAWHGGFPADLKQLIEFTLLTDQSGSNHTGSSIDITFRTDLDPSADTVTTDNNNIGWGGPWGDLPWGGVPNPHKYRQMPTQEKSYGTFWNNGFVHRRAGEKISILGSVYHWDLVSENTNR